MEKEPEKCYRLNGRFYNYECDRCKIDIGVGTGYCFEQGGPNCHLCRPCYEIFWDGWGKIEKEYVQKFLKKEESVEPPE